MKKIIVVDGYNVIRRIPDWNTLFCHKLSDGRDALIRHCVECKSHRKDISMFYVVFDGDSKVFNDRNQPAQGVHVVFTKTGESADERIVSLVRENQDDYDCVVASDDREVTGRARQLGASAMSVLEFYGLGIEVRQPCGRDAESNAKTGLTPQQEKEINDELKKAWGVE